MSKSNYLLFTQSSNGRLLDEQGKGEGVHLSVMIFFDTLPAFPFRAVQSFLTISLFTVTSPGQIFICKA